jgi:hypothetical protein
MYHCPDLLSNALHTQVSNVLFVIYLRIRKKREGKEGKVQVMWGGKS